MKKQNDFLFYRNTIRTLNRVELVHSAEDYVAKFGELYGLALPKLFNLEEIEIEPSFQCGLDVTNVERFLQTNYYNAQAMANPLNVIIGCAVDKMTKDVFQHLWIVDAHGENIEVNPMMNPEDYLYYAINEIDGFEIVKKVENENLDDDMGVEEGQPEEEIDEAHKFVFPHIPPRHPHYPFHGHNRPKFPHVEMVHWSEIKKFIHPVAQYEVEYYTTQPQI